MDTVSHAPPGFKYLEPHTHTGPTEFVIHWGDREILRHCATLLDTGPADSITQELIGNCLLGILERMQADPHE